MIEALLFFDGCFDVKRFLGAFIAIVASSVVSSAESSEESSLDVGVVVVTAAIGVDV